MSELINGCKNYEHINGKPTGKALGPISYQPITVLRTGSMGHLSKSPTTISKISSNFGKIGLKKMLGGVVLPPRTLFSPGVSFSQWTSQ